jgi:hypothetical protein
MTRLVTAPFVGALVGALEGGIVFTVMTIIDVRRGAYAGIDNDLIYLGAIYGMIFGGFVGGVTGLIVALRDARGRGGLLLGTAIGFACAIFIYVRVGPLDDMWTMLALIVIPGAASMGLMSAILTASRKKSAPPATTNNSHRIIS